MLSEVSNALLITFLATEYLVVNSVNNSRTMVDLWELLLRSPRRHFTLFGTVALVNLMDRMSGLASSGLFQGLMHMPRVLFAAVAYVVALYMDCRRHCSELPVGQFLLSVGAAFCYVLPVYPFLAVLISFVFMFVIRIFELLNWDLAILNMPIYYGTLYGPFSMVYLRVKRKLVYERTSLPT